MNNFYKFAIFVLVLISTGGGHCENVFQEEISGETVFQNDPLLANKTSDRKTAKQGGDLVEQAGNYWTGIASQITGVLDNLTLDNLLLESSKRIPEDTRLALENAISGVPEPLSSFLKGPLEQINDFLQIGKGPSTPSTTPPYADASTFEPDYYTVAPVETFPSEPDSTTGEPPLPQNFTQPQNTHQFFPQTSFIQQSNATIPSFINRNRKPTAPPNKSSNSLSNLMQLINNQPLSNLFENVSNTISNTNSESAQDSNSVVHLFQNISSQFQTTPAPPLDTNTNVDFTDDEDESLPILNTLQQSNSTYNIQRFSMLHKQLVSELKTLTNATNNYKANYQYPQNQFSNSNSLASSNGQQYNNNQGIGNYNAAHGNFNGAQGNGAQGNFNGPQDNFNGGQGNFNGGQGNFNGGQGNFNGGQGNFNGPQGNFNGPQGNFNGPQGNFNGAQDDFNGGQGNANGAQGNFNGAQGNFINGGQGNFNGAAQGNSNGIKVLGSFNGGQGSSSGAAQEDANGIQVLGNSNGVKVLGNFNGGQGNFNGVAQVSQGNPNGIQVLGNTNGIKVLGNFNGGQGNFNGVAQGNPNGIKVLGSSNGGQGNFNGIQVLGSSNGVQSGVNGLQSNFNGVKSPEVIAVAPEDQYPPPPAFSSPHIQIITIAGEPTVTVGTTQSPVPEATERIVSTATEDEDDGEDEDALS